MLIMLFIKSVEIVWHQLLFLFDNPGRIVLYFFETFNLDGGVWIPYRIRIGILRQFYYCMVQWFV